MPLIFSFSGLDKFFFKINYNIVVPTFFIIVSLLLISTIPTYSFKKIVIPRSMTKFLLFGIVLFFGALLIYTFKILTISSVMYLCLIPISYFHYKKIKKRKNIINEKSENEDLEDIL
jgi:CDP-diacylglycerol--serine O-phosphatidyltransferase